MFFLFDTFIFIFNFKEVNVSDNDEEKTEPRRQNVQMKECVFWLFFFPDCKTTTALTSPEMFVREMCRLFCGGLWPLQWEIKMTSEVP